MGRDVAPVIAAEMMLRHGMAEDLVAAYAARTFALDAAECRAVLTAAHILLRREMREVTPLRQPPVIDGGAFVASVPHTRLGRSEST